MSDRTLPEDQRSDDATTPAASAWAEPAASKPGSIQPAREPAIGQLETIIENLASYATPVLREIAARAAELAAKAGQAAGPLAHKAAEKTEEVGGRLATKGREVASDLRRDTSALESGGDEMTTSEVTQTPEAEEAGLPQR